MEKLCRNIFGVLCRRISSGGNSVRSPCGPGEIRNGMRVMSEQKIEDFSRSLRMRREGVMPRHLSYGI